MPILAGELMGARATKFAVEVDVGGGEMCCNLIEIDVLNETGVGRVTFL
jgi:hypothetical protein